MELHKWLAHDIRDDSDLDRVPVPVIEAVLRVGIRRLAEVVPAEFDASEMDAADFERCEGCSTLIDPQNPAGASYGGEDGVWLCDACLVEAQEAAPDPSSGDSDTPTASPPENAADADTENGGEP